MGLIVRHYLENTGSFIKVYALKCKKLASDKSLCYAVRRRVIR